MGNDNEESSFFGFRLDGVLGGSASCGPCGVRLKGLEFCCPGAWACDPPASCILSRYADSTLLVVRSKY